MGAAKKICKTAQLKVGDAGSVQAPTIKTISAMLEARSMHFPRFKSSEEIFQALDRVAQQNEVLKKAD